MRRKMTAAKALGLGLVVCVLAIGLFTPAYAGEDSALEIYKFPKVASQYALWGGYRLAHLKGSELALEYGHTTDSIAFGGRVIAFPFPHRIHIDLNVQSSKEYFSDIRYAYSDSVFFRFLGRSLFHNLQNIELIDMNPATISPSVQRLDAGEKYGFRTGLSHAFLRFKAPDYPLHVYIDGKTVGKYGTMQQRFLGGAGYYTRLVRVSEKRDVDWRTTDIAVGLNSHLGPVEIDFSHSEKSFSAGAGVMSFTYVPAGVTLPHNVIPDTNGSTNTLKIHTSYTGKLVASATLSETSRTNELSDAKADYFIGEGQVRYMPVTKLLLSVKYRREKADFDNPNSLPAGYLGFVDFAGVSNIKNSISTTTDTLSANIQYKACANFTIGADASHKRIDRENADEWELPDVTEVKTFGLNATLKPIKSLKLKAKYGHIEYDKPAYNHQPNSSNTGGLSASWAPIKRLSVFLSYDRTKEKRDDAELAAATDKNRDVRRDKFAGNLTFLIREDLSLAAGYTYWMNKVEEDLAYTATISDDDVRYRDIARNYTVALSYVPEKRVDLTAEVSHTVGKGDFFPNTAPFASSPSIDSYSALHLRATEYVLRGKYRMPRNTEVALDYSYTNFSNKLENPDNPEYSDGNSQVVLVTLTKRW